MLDFIKELDRQFEGLVLAVCVFILSFFFSSIAFVKRNLEELRTQSVTFNIVTVLLNAIISASFGVVVFQLLLEYQSDLKVMTNFVIAVFGSAFFHVFIMVAYAKLNISKKEF